MITKQQLIDKLNELTDDPNEEIFAFWDDCVWEIHDISITDQEQWDHEKRKDIAGLRIIIDCS